MSNKSTRFKLVFFSPAESTRAILDHLFQKFPNELGKIGEYDQCAFICAGMGQFRPSAAANPTVGKSDKLELVREDRVELIVNDKGEKEELKKAIAELRQVHPYEAAVYDVYRIEDI